MQNTALSPGDSIEARCTKCRKNTGHIVITIAEGTPVDVQCNGCSRQHKYRPPTKTVKSASPRTAPPKDAERKEWQTLRPGMNSDEAINYSMTTACKTKTLINHPVFGLGLVQRVAGPQKVEVLFEDGKKIMRCK
ncbi:MAG TPA: hypothetical protein VJ955_06480 [Desulfuromonadales bacterium]|nr:hypothetical protein [Desulfuromonadales bacterium]